MKELSYPNSPLFLATLLRIREALDGCFSRSSDSAVANGMEAGAECSIWLRTNVVDLVSLPGCTPAPQKTGLVVGSIFPTTQRRDVVKTKSLMSVKAIRNFYKRVTPPSVTRAAFGGPSICQSGSPDSALFNNISLGC